MLSKLLALSSVSLVNAAPASVTALCNALITNCGSAQFAALAPSGTVTAAQCETLFNAITPAITVGDDTDVKVNSIGCRQKFAVMASNNTALCRYASITGAGQCGTDVAGAACAGIRAACGGVPNPPYASQQECTGNLSAIAAHWGSKIGTPAAAENSLECRVYHSLVGWNGGTPDAGTNVHCSHVFFPGDPNWCGGTISTDAEHHCRTINTHCTGALTQYNNDAQCMASFMAFPDGTAQDTNAANDRGCRQYHAQAGATVNPVHCLHGGPSGQGVCGGANGTRDAWRILAGNAACAAGGANTSWVGTSVGAAFASWNRADLDMVIPTAVATNFTVAATGDNEFCRLYHLTVAAAGGALLDHCEHGSITSSQCFDGTNAPGIRTICRMITTGCGTTMPNGAYATVDACYTALLPVAARPGDPTQMIAAAADTLACRAYHAALALTARRAGTSVDANCANARATAGPGCGGGGAAKSDAATLVLSAAAALPVLFAM